MYLFFLKLVVVTVMYMAWQLLR